MVQGDWPVVESAEEYDCGWFSVGYDKVEQPDGELADYYWVDAPDAVTVVAITDDDELVLVEEYRPRQREILLTCPVGGRDDEESFEAAARRELEEETGYRADSVEVLETYYGSGWLRRQRGVVLASGLTPGEQALDDGEFIDVHTVPVSAAFDVLEDHPTVAWSLFPLLVARDHGRL